MKDHSSHLQGPIPTDVSRHLHHLCFSFVSPVHQGRDLSKMWGAIKGPQTWGLWTAREAGKEKAGGQFSGLKESKWGSLQPPHLDHPRENGWVEICLSNLPCLRIRLQPIRIKIQLLSNVDAAHLLLGTSFSRDSEKTWEFFSLVASSSVLPGGFQPWTWLCSDKV